MERSLRGSFNFNISSNHQNGPTAMEEDHVTKEKKLDDINNIPLTENATKMEVDATEQDPGGKIKENIDPDSNSNEVKLNHAESKHITSTKKSSVQSVLESQQMREKHTIEEKFKFCPKDITSLFQSAQTEKICMKCCKLETEDMKVYKCKECPGYYHEKCGHQKVSKELTCKQCSSEDKYCFSCKKVVSSDEKFICKNSDCKQIYHKSCLQMSPNFNGNSGICPLHSCHTCKWKLTYRNGSIVKCMKCPVAYHSDIYCLPAGTKVISKDHIFCPRHKTRDEEKLKHLNIDFCNNCTHSGEVICCDTCPISVHEDCIPEYSSSDPNSEKFICDNCHNGSIPLYNTVVWAKVGPHRWWPCYILTPQQSVTKGCRKSDRQFCVLFFGTYEHYWLTFDRVYGYNLQEGESKASISKKSIDRIFVKALQDANIIHNLYKEDERTKLKHFQKILHNRPIYPVTLKKAIAEEDKNCSCKPDDPSPCGFNSGCILRIIKYECSKSCPAGDKCQNQKLRKRDYDFIELCPKNLGYGAFAKKDIPKNTVVCEYVGDLINRQEYERRAALKQARGERDYYYMKYDTNLIVDAEPAGNLSRFINHSYYPNCEVIKIIVDGIIRLGIFSINEIPMGTEITYNEEGKD